MSDCHTIYSHSSRQSSINSISAELNAFLSPPPPTAPPAPFTGAAWSIPSCRARRALYWSKQGFKQEEKIVSGLRRRIRKNSNRTNLLERKLGPAGLEVLDEHVRTVKEELPERPPPLKVGLGRVVDERLEGLLQGEHVALNLDG